MDLILHQNDRFSVRLAEQADSARLCELLKKVHIKSKLDVSQERDPDFYALLRLHSDQHEVFLGENKKGTLGGCGTMTFRPGWLDGRVQTVSYLGDLRVVPGFRAPRGMPLAFELAMRRAREVYDAHVHYTVIFDSNAIAKRALLGREDRRRDGQPLYRVMTPFQMISVQFVGKKPAPEPSIQEAGAADVDELVEFLARQQQARLLGYVFDRALLELRLARWPQFYLSDFLISRNGAGHIDGVLAPFDAEPVKRTRVLGYYGEMRLIRALFSASAFLRGHPSLPKPGECFRFAFLSHMEIEGDDPHILRELLRAAYQRLAPRGLHFMSAMVPRGSALEAAFSGFTVTRTPMTVYAVTLPDGPYAQFDFSSLRPGFEMALS